jgi:hypothetical protein
MEEYIPKVNVAKELREISRDFIKPEEVIREAISNALDAQAENIYIKVYDNVKSAGTGELVIEIMDTGVGMTLDELKAFFDLGKSIKKNKETSIGEKGHGTKIYYNSSEVQVFTRYLYNPEIVYSAKLLSPIEKLNSAYAQGKDNPPKVSISETDISELPEGYNDNEKFPFGTLIIIKGYEENNFRLFGHEQLRDYIRWFTAWGSIGLILGKKENIYKLFLCGLGRTGYEEIDFGHPFPDENYDFDELKKDYARRPESIFVKRWILKNISIENYPQHHCDIVFSVEGDRAKRDHNEMLKWLGKVPQDRYKGDGRYSVQDRYGIYLCKDFIPIQRKNEEFSEKTEWTKWHSFINCDAFSLTANRSSIDNTSQELLRSIIKTAKKTIDDQVFDSDDYREFLSRLRIDIAQRKAEKEKSEVIRRLKKYQKKKLLKINRDNQEFTFKEPDCEQGVIWLIASILAKWPEEFGWSILDIDQHFGYDFLVERNHPLTNEKDCAFVECKYDIREGDEFNHSFKYLEQIICWDCKLSEGDVMQDMARIECEFQVSKPSNEKEYTRYFLNIKNDVKKIEVVNLSKRLLETLNLSRIE